jgi:thiol-disulfide isomerase/thioredoxin
MPSALSELSNWCLVLGLLMLVTSTRASELREIRGRVVDAKGQPVADAVVADFWRANGTGKDQDGKSLDLKIEENVKKFWGHMGEMEPVGKRVATTGSDGRFTVTIPTSRHAVMAMDRQRRRGGLQVLPKGKEQESMEIRIGPLLKVRGSLRGPGRGEKPGWTHVYLNLPDDPTRPLDSTRLVSCGSFEARFEMSLPPGRYVLQAHNETLDAYLVPDQEIDLAFGRAELDLGVLMLSNTKSHTAVKIEQAKSRGDWVDTTDRYGKPAPRWHITDARGIPKDIQIKDFKGKWLLIYFWGFGCAPCLSTGLPSLARFYEEHAADRDRFEIVAFCIDDDGELTSMAAVDRKLDPVVKHVWGGRALPFPSVLDASFQTVASFGINTLGPHLVDPEGILMKGDETVLGEKLKEREDRSRGKSAPHP